MKTKKYKIPENIGRLNKILNPGEYNICAVDMLCQSALEIYDLNKGNLVAVFEIPRNSIKNINIDIKLNPGLNIVNLEAPKENLVIEILGNECFS